jgi:hypothetical protein
MQDVDRADAPANHPAREPAPDGLDLGKFGHRVPVSQSVSVGDVEGRTLGRVERSLGNVERSLSNR